MCLLKSSEKIPMAVLNEEKLKEIALSKDKNAVDEAYNFFKTNQTKSINIKGTEKKIITQKGYKNQNVIDTIHSSINTYIKGSEFEHLLDYSGDFYIYPKPLIETSSYNYMGKEYTSGVPTYGFNKLDIYLADNTELKGVIDVDEIHLPLAIDTVLHELVEGFYKKNTYVKSIIDKYVSGYDREETIDAMVLYITGGKHPQNRDVCYDIFKEKKIPKTEMEKVLSVLG